MNINNSISFIDNDRVQFQIEADLLNALSHPARLEILELLRDGESCVCHIQAMLDHRQAYISQQLNILRHAGLITSRKDGLRVYYKIIDPEIFQLLDQVEALMQKLGKLQPDESRRAKLIQKMKACNCPQCSSLAEQQFSKSIKVNYA